MHIGAEPHVVGKVPAVMVRIGIEHNIVAVPEPAVYKIVIVGSNLEEEAAEFKSVPVSATKPEYMIRADWTGKMSMLPWAINMIVGIVSAAVVADPPVVFGMNVGCF